MAIPCLLGAAALGLIIYNQLARQGRTRAGWLALALCVANPITLRALEIGHPEELLGGVLCVAAVLAAIRDRPVWAGLLLGLAVANKEWAVLAIPPVAFALRTGRWRAATVATATAALVLAPLALHGSSGISTARGIAASSGAGFTPQQLWWFLGTHGRVIGVNGLMPGYRVPPAWLVPIGHLAVVAAGFGASAVWWVIRRGRSTPYEPLLLLAFVMLMRCVIDPWNILYYALPFLMALVAWEGVGQARAPLGTLTVTLALWVAWELMGPNLSPDMKSLSFLLWALPVTAVLGWRLYAPGSLVRRLTPATRSLAARLPSLAPALSSR
jgi:hypothetical protein